MSSQVLIMHCEVTCHYVKVTIMKLALTACKFQAFLVGPLKTSLNSEVA